ncbi:MAG: hypothetical protein GX556_12730 [Fibrobacter sp.]|nr:hypothetical protein [Fibrobacter sp.]
MDKAYAEVIKVRPARTRPRYFSIATQVRVKNGENQITGKDMQWLRKNVPFIIPALNLILTLNL